MNRIYTALLLSLLLCIICCGDEKTVTVYSVSKVNPKESYGHKWLPLNPTTYKIENGQVISSTAGFLSKYQDCAVMSVADWECRYRDSSGRFGIRNGEYWEYPEKPDTRIVSRWEYNKIRCDWAINDGTEGKFMGAVRCLWDWR